MSTAAGECCSAGTLVGIGIAVVLGIVLVTLAAYLMYFVGRFVVHVLPPPVHVLPPPAMSHHPVRPLGHLRVPPPRTAQTQQVPHRRRVLVLDLDETMGHTLFDEGGEMTFVRRPHLETFLRAVAGPGGFDEVAVFTAGTREYAEPILDALDPEGRLFGRRYYRDSCTVTPGGLVVKDLRILGERDLADVLLLDNTPSAYAWQPQCGVPIPSFMGDDPLDDALLQTLGKFDQIAGLRMSRDPLAF
jgi:Dullard-like phosphatase family protein